MQGFKILVLLAFSLIMFSCKKDKLKKEDDTNTDVNTPPPTTDRTELTKDSIFLYAKQVYLWNSYLPTYSVFKPRSYNKYTDQFDNYYHILFGISDAAKNPATGQAFEYWEDYPDEPKFSYIDDAETDGVVAYIPGQKSYVDLDDKGNDIGLGLAYAGSVSDYKIYVKYVSPGSPAATKGIKRGTIINKINNVVYGSDFDREIRYNNAYWNAIEGNTVLLNITAPDNTTSTITLNKTPYVSSPIYKDTVFVREGNNIGYLAYARFSDLNYSEDILNNAFANFAAKNVNSLIIDLRYNGGGYVKTAEKLINLIIPQEHNGKLIFTERFNETMRAGKANLLKNQFYEYEGRMLSYGDIDYSNWNTIALKGGKPGYLTSSSYLTNIQKVVFIVGNNTASSSELVINSLKPYIDDIQLVGEQTFGKPVGFFPVRIDKYDVYYSMFETRNSLGAGGYYSGMEVDETFYEHSLLYTDKPYGKEFGDPAEDITKIAIAYIVTGDFGGVVTSQSKSSDSKILQTDKTLQREGFKGMIETPERLFGR